MLTRFTYRHVLRAIRVPGLHLCGYGSDRPWCFTLDNRIEIICVKRLSDLPLDTWIEIGWQFCERNDGVKVRWRALAASGRRKPYSIGD